MGAKVLSLEKRAELFQLYCKHQQVKPSAEEGGVSRTTAEKYRVIDKWDERLTNIKEHAEAIVDAKSEKRLAQNLIVLKLVKSKIIEAVKKGKVLGSVSDLIGAIKTEELLLGRPDSRPAKTDSPEIDEAKLDAEIIELGEEVGFEIQPNGKTQKRLSSVLAGKRIPSDHKK